MTGVARDLRVRTVQCEMRQLGMVIDRGLPLVGVVASPAGRAPAAFVAVVARMAGNAFHRRVLVRWVAMAI